MVEFFAPQVETIDIAGTARPLIGVIGGSLLSLLVTRGFARPRRA